MESERTRRNFLRLAGSAVGLLALGGGATRVLADAVRAPGPYGPLGTADENGVRVPTGFSARLVARTGDTIGPTDHIWHRNPDGGGCIATEGGGFVYLSNSEVKDGGGGVGAVEFDAAGAVVAARTVLSGTSRNCSGGLTPWGTWLTCEENGAEGRVFECSPSGEGTQVLPALGKFNHEAAEVVESTGHVFMTEDRGDGRLYRFTPTTWPDLTRGVLEAASVGPDGAVTWVAVSPDRPARTSTTTAFRAGEGLAHHGDSLFIATKHDRRIWRYDLQSERIDVLHDCVRQPDTALDTVDNLEIDRWTGDLLIAEDGPTQHLCILSTDEGGATVAPLVEFVGHGDSEVTGPSFSPDGRTLMVSSQRGTDGRGMTFAITGPFRGRPTTTPSTSTTTSTTTTTTVPPVPTTVVSSASPGSSAADVGVAEGIGAKAGADGLDAARRLGRP